MLVVGVTNAIDYTGSSNVKRRRVQQRLAYAETSEASLPRDSRPTTSSQPPTCFWSIVTYLSYSSPKDAGNSLMKILGTVRWPVFSRR